MKLWHIDSSILGDNSASRALSAKIVAQERTKHSGLEVSYLDLAAEPLAHLSPGHVAAMFGQPATDPAVAADFARGSACIDTLFAADIVVIGAPMYNFGLSTQLKALFDRLLIAGKTFQYGQDGVPFGLVPADKRVIVASSRGGVYSAGSPAAGLDHQETHLTALLNFIGLKDIVFIRAEGLALPGQREPAMLKAEAEINRL